MYTIINQNIDRILDHIDEKLDIRTYLFLLNRVRKTDVTRDLNFQKEYCRYWRLHGAGLDKEFLSVYFELMEKTKDTVNSDIAEITRKLYEIPTNIKGKKTLQFSFSSKLLHSLDPHKPIYDKMVAGFYNFPVPNHAKSYEDRLQSFLSFYNSLFAEYMNVLNKGLLSQAMEGFKRRFSIPATYTDEKIVDTLIWRAMDLRNKGII